MYVTWNLQCVILGCGVLKCKLESLCDGACLSMWQSVRCVKGRYKCVAHIKL